MRGVHESTSMIKQRVAIGLGCLALVILAVYLAVRESPAPQSPGELQDRTASRRSGDGTPDESLTERTSPIQTDRFDSSDVAFPAPITVVDRLSRRSLPGVVLSSVQDEGGGPAALVSDDDGSLPSNSVFPADGRLFVRFPDSLGAGNAIVSLGDCLVLAPTGERQLLVPAYAQVDVSVDCEVVGLLRAAEAKVISLPPLPQRLTSRQVESLGMQRDHYPEMYIERLQALGIRDSGAVSVSAKLAERRSTLFLPWSGEAVVICQSTASVPSLARATVTRGERVTVPIELKAPTTVAGQVVDERGRGVPSAKVGVAARTWFTHGEFAPASRDQKRSPGVIVYRDRGATGGSNCLVTRSTRTDSAGRFRVQLPFSDHVAAWAFIAEHDRGYRESRATNRNAPVEGIRLVVRRASESAQMTVVSDSGDPVGGLRFSVGEIAHPFQVQIPAFKTDQNGRFSIGWLRHGAEHQMFTHGADFHSGKFRPSPGGTVTVQRVRR